MLLLLDNFFPLFHFNLKGIMEISQATGVF